MGTNAFRRALSATLVFVFSTHSIVWAGPRAELKAGELMKEVVTHFDQSKSIDEFIQGHEGLLTQKDIGTLKQKIGNFQKLKQNGGVGIRGDQLIVTVGKEKATVGIKDLATYTLTVNGKDWQYNPYQSVEANAESLQKVLSSEKHALLNQLWEKLIPSAHADGGISLLIWVLALLAAALFAAYFVHSLRASGYLAVSCVPIKDKNGQDAFQVKVTWKNDGNTKKFIIDPSDPDSPKLKSDSEIDQALGNDTLCALDAGWNATGTCPAALKILPELSRLKKMQDICKDPDRLAKLNKALPGDKRVDPSKVNKVLSEPGADVPN